MARELPRGLRPILDRWLTESFAGPEAPGWPGGGWRALLPWAEGAATALVLPSADRAGRSFPLAGLCLTPATPTLEGAEAWCRGAAPALAAATAGKLDADELQEALARLPPPPGTSPPLAGAVVWREGEAPRLSGDTVSSG